MKKCSVDECDIKHHAKLYCQSHYHKMCKWIQSRLIYRTYTWMKQRCYNINHPKYVSYGLRWIKVCDRRLGLNWFNSFCDDMWERVNWLTLDRIDNNWNYEPWNCRRATNHQQASNKRNNNKCVGVCYSKKINKWIAKIELCWKIVFCKLFTIYEEAVKARKDAEVFYKIYN